MKLIKQEINTQSITNYCGILYEGEPIIFINDRILAGWQALRVRNNTTIRINLLDTSKITEEVFFKNSIDLYKWAASKLTTKAHTITVFYKAKYGEDVVKGMELLDVVDIDDSNAKEALFEKFKHLRFAKLLEFKII